MIKLSQILAGRLIPLKIRVNSVQPGIFPSEMTDAASPKDYENPDHKMHGSIKANPIQRSGTVQDFAGLMIMMSSRAGAYLNGASITIDGGRVLTQSAA